MTGQSPRGHATRGVRLSDLDRGVVYRIGYVRERRRWEVLGPAAPQAAERDAERTDAGAARACASPAAPAAGPRHAVAEPAR